MTEQVAQRAKIAQLRVKIIHSMDKRKVVVVFNIHVYGQIWWPSWSGDLDFY